MRTKDTSIICMRELENGDYVCLRRMLLGNVRLSLVDMHPDEHSCFHSPNYCYHDPNLAYLAYRNWDGEGDPPKGWVRHIESGRRMDPETGEEWVAQ